MLERMQSRVVLCHVLIVFFLVGRLHFGGFQLLTDEQIFSLLFVSHLEAISCAFCFCQELTSTDFLLCFVVRLF